MTRRFRAAGHAEFAAWLDGLPVHDVVLYVRLACGHERESRGWRGEEGAYYCCDVCHRMTVMEVIAMTDRPPSPWRLGAA